MTQEKILPALDDTPKWEPFSKRRILQFEVLSLLKFLAVQLWGVAKQLALQGDMDFPPASVSGFAWQGWRTETSLPGPADFDASHGHLDPRTGRLPIKTGFTGPTPCWSEVAFARTLPSTRNNGHNFSEVYGSAVVPER